MKLRCEMGFNRWTVVFLSTALLLATLTLSANSAFALPFNDDMVNNQIRTGLLMRPLPKGSVPLGSLANRLEKKDDALNLSNPKKGDPISTATGKRLFAVNCSPCHGDITKSPWTPGAAANGAGKVPGVPDITRGDLGVDYLNKPDGFFYGTIHFGGQAIMPPYGWKLSPSEHWDIVNYVKSVQAAKNKEAKTN